MLKKIIFIIIAIVIVISFRYFIYQPKVSVPIKEPILTIDTTYFIEGQEVNLVNGRSEQIIASSPASKIVTQYFGNEVEADFNNDGITDAAYLLTQDRGGSGTFFYVAAVISSKNSFQSTNTILLGDRIAPQTTEYQNGEIIVNYAERRPGEPMTTPPSLGVSKYFQISDNKLIEINK
jgi:hypothetical protein